MWNGTNRELSKAAVVLAVVTMACGSGWAQSSKGSSLPDAQIEANVLKSLAGASELANENIVTNTVFGTVTLSGTVKDEPTRQMAENLASRAEGVKKVVDELTLSGVGGGQGVSGASQGDSSQGVLQSDGTMAPAPGQHAPEPDVYAQQHGLTDAGPQTGQSNPPADMAENATAPPAYRQPFPQNGNGQQPYAQGGQQPYPVDNNQQPYGQDRRQRPYQGEQRNAPPPYGAQLAGQPVTVPPGALLRIRINEGLDSKHTQPGTPFDAVVLNDVVADGAVAIPRGASVQGVVVDSKSGGVIKGHGELALKLNQVTLSGRTFPITSDVWSVNSSDKGGQTVGSAVGLGAFGALIGAVAGGGPGAAIGAGAGAAAGVGASAASGSRQVLIPSEAILTFRLVQPAPLVTISQAEMDRLSYGVPAGGPQSPQMRRRYGPPPPYYGPVYYPRPYPYPY